MKKLLHFAAPIFLLCVAIMAAMLSSPNYSEHSFILLKIHYYASHEFVHIIAHILIFWATILMVGLWTEGRLQRILMWGTIIGGTLLIEVVQMVIGPITGYGIWNAFFDMGVNVLGAGLGLLTLAQIQKNTPPDSTQKGEDLIE